MPYRFLFPALTLLCSFLSIGAARAEEEVEFALFKRWVEAGQVEQCLIDDDKISGHVNENGTRRGFVTSRPPDAEFIPLLERHGVSYSRQPSGSTPILGWLPPLGLLLAGSAVVLLAVTWLVRRRRQ